MNSFKYIFLLCFITLCISCKKIEPPSDTGLSYFPLKLGAEKKYALDSIRYNSIANTNDSSRTYLKEIITEETNDTNDYQNFKIEVYSTKDTTKDWKFVSYYFYKKNEYLINYVKGGLILTQFIFPVTKGRKWNINAFNSWGLQNATYSFVSKPWMNYQDCVEVLVNNEINAIEETIDKRIYCRDLGLIFSLISQIKIQNLKKDGIITRITLIPN